MSLRETINLNLKFYTMKSKKSTYRGLEISVILFLAFSISVSAQWNVPENAKKQKAPQNATYELVKTGKSVYTNKCASCHGNPGKGDFLKLNPAPADFGTEKFQKENTEGSVFFKMNEGMGGMPSFKHQLSETDKWCVTFYIKSFDEDFIVKGKKAASVETAIKVSLNNETKEINVSAEFKNDQNKMVPLKGADLDFFVKRYFGNLPIGDATTDEEGKAVINFPDDIAGDSVGNAEIIVKFNDTDAYGKTFVTKTVSWANPVHYENPLNERHMWGNRASAPLWILITYFSVVLAVWAVIFWVIFKITRIKKLTK